MAERTAVSVLRGGLNLITPALTMPDGHLMGGLNYEPEPRGYRRIDGYEAYDGQPRPSAQSYSVLDFDAGTAAISEGDTVTGATSGATGKALIDAVVESGSYGGSDAAGYLVLTSVNGTFQDDENLQVSAATKCVANGTASDRGADTDANDATWLADAIATARALIAKPAGSGPVRGVFVLNGVLHCIRDNVSATAAVLYKSTTAGWSAQDLGSYIRFDAGTTEFVEGETLTGGTSGATATIRRVVLHDGAWDGSGEGLLTLTGVSGTFQNDETITGGTSSGSATANGVVLANGLPAGGIYDSVVQNFYGAAYEPRAYCAQGVGRAFEWDGSYFTPVFADTNAANDKPTKITVFANHLVLGYPSGTVNISEPGTPLQFDSTGGAVTFDFGSAITDFPGEEATVLPIFGRDRIGYLQGKDADTFELKYVSYDSGALSWTVQNAGGPIYCDDAGLRRLAPSDVLGNWDMGTLSRLVEPIFENKRRAGVSVSGSVRVRGKDQYRLFFDDKTGLTVWLGLGLQTLPEIIPFELDHQMVCSCTGYIGSEERESVFVGTDDGWVMELDRGTSFNGENILSWIRLAFNHVGSPQVNKRFHKVTLELSTGPVASLTAAPEYDFGNAYEPSGQESDFTVQPGGGFWNEVDWNNFYWSSQPIGEGDLYLEGFGRNMSLVVFSESNDEQSHVIASVAVDYSFRGRKK